MNIKKLLQATVLSSMTVFCGLASAQTLKIGTEATYAPFEYTDDQANIIGYDIDIINAIAKVQGFEVEVLNMPFDGLIPALMTQQINASIAAISITPERQKRVDFTQSYYTSGISILIRQEDKEIYKSSKDLAGKRLCAQIGTTGALSAQKTSPNNVAAFNTEPEAFIELKAKGCEAVINDRPVNLHYLSTSKSEGVMEIPEILSAEEYGIAVRKGDTETLKLLNEGLDKIKASGEFAKIHEKWFGVSK